VIRSTATSSTSSPSTQSELWTGTTYAPINSDSFCDAHGTPHPRFPAQYLAREGSWRSEKHIFLSMLPVAYLQTTVVPHTSARLQRSGDDALAFDEFLIYIAYWILLTLESFDARTECWSRLTDELTPPRDIGRFGMTSARFEQITRSLMFAPPAQPTMSSPKFDLFSPPSTTTCAQFSNHRGCAL
jgi:hypothetical protein